MRSFRVSRVWGGRTLLKVIDELSEGSWLCLALWISERSSCKTYCEWYIRTKSWTGLKGDRLYSLKSLGFIFCSLVCFVFRWDANCTFNKQQDTLRSIPFTEGVSCNSLVWVCTTAIEAWYATSCFIEAILLLLIISSLNVTCLHYCDVPSEFDHESLLSLTVWMQGRWYCKGQPRF